MSPDITERFPGAIIVEEPEFARAIAGRQFRYRRLGSELMIERPVEAFQVNGAYQLHRSRSILYGTYSIERGKVTINCTDCPVTFLGLGRERVFFRHEERLLVANADGRGSVIELIPVP